MEHKVILIDVEAIANIIVDFVLEQQNREEDTSAYEVTAYEIADRLGVWEEVADKIAVAKVIE